MSWNEIVVRFRGLADACVAGAPLELPWAEFKAAVEATADRPPTHLHTVLDELSLLEGTKGRESVCVLDHGTGTGINLFFLAALGYRHLWGANVFDKAQAYNRIFNEILNIEGERIFVYDGEQLPLNDNCVDLVISQTVVEHVPDHLLETYYSEQGRVLRLSGRAVHQVPHRLMPYDSHTRTWFVHYVPACLQRPLYKAFGDYPEQVGTLLFLRWPWVHRRLARRYIGPTFDRTSERLALSPDFDAFEGPQTLRRVLDISFNAPAVGRLMRWLVSPLMMMESVSARRTDKQT